MQVEAKRQVMCCLKLRLQRPFPLYFPIRSVGCRQIEPCDLNCLGTGVVEVRLNEERLPGNGNLKDRLRTRKGGKWTGRRLRRGDERFKGGIQSQRQRVLKLNVLLLQFEKHILLARIGQIARFGLRDQLPQLAQSCREIRRDGFRLLGLEGRRTLVDRAQRCRTSPCFKNCVSPVASDAMPGSDVSIPS